MAAIDGELRARLLEIVKEYRQDYDHGEPSIIVANDICDRIEEAVAVTSVGLDTDGSNPLAATNIWVAMEQWANLVSLQTQEDGTEELHEWGPAVLVVGPFWSEAQVKAYCARQQHFNRMGQLANVAHAQLTAVPDWFTA